LASAARPFSVFSCIDRNRPADQRAPFPCWRNTFFFFCPRESSAIPPAAPQAIGQLAGPRRRQPAMMARPAAGVVVVGLAAERIALPARGTSSMRPLEYRAPPGNLEKPCHPQGVRPPCRPPLNSSPLCGLDQGRPAPRHDGRPTSFSAFGLVQRLMASGP